MHFFIMQLQTGKSKEENQWDRVWFGRAGRTDGRSEEYSWRRAEQNMVRLGYWNMYIAQMQLPLPTLPGGAKFNAKSREGGKLSLLIGNGKSNKRCNNVT